MKILVVNGGSSSYKLALYNQVNGALNTLQKPIWNTTCELKAKDTHHPDTKTILQKLLHNAIDSGAITALSDIDIVGHRVVHGGDIFQKPTLINPQVKEDIKKLFLLAPLHNPANLDGIEIMEQLLPNVPQVAVFDTAFHATLSEAANTYAGPYEWKKLGIKRYGFHGINYQYCSTRCATLLQKNEKDLKLVCCHLGNGASMAAIDGGRSIDTTMGFTPLEGLMMGSRCGSIDPDITLFLQRHHKTNVDELTQMLNKASGLLGISGSSSDMRDILKLKANGNKRATLAFEMYIHSLKRNLGAMIGVLTGLDAIVFTGGVGEHATDVRQGTCQGMEHLGIKLDEQKNRAATPDAIISAADSRVAILVVSAQEEWTIACACRF